MGYTPDKKKILIFAHYYYPDVASTGQLLKDLVEGMLDEFDVTVICVVPSYGGTIEDKYKKQKYYFEELNGVKIIRIRVPEFTKANKSSRIKNASYHRIMSCFNQSVTAENYPRLTVENLYKLRCNFLHSGNIEIKSSFFQEFCLMKPESMGFVKNNLPAEWKIIHTTNENNDAVYRIEIDVKHLCLTICNAAEKYYNTKNSNDFINHTMEIR